MKSRLGAALLLAILVTGTVTGCSASAGTGTKVSSDELAKQVSSVLAKQVGQVPDKVVCPDSLPAKKGAKVRCTLTDSGTSYGVSVTAKGGANSDGIVPVHVQVDQKPKG